MQKMFVIAVVTICMLESCRYFNSRKPSAGQQVIARVGDEFLYLSDALELLHGKTGKDSATLVADYAEAWARKKMLLRKAEENIAADELGIDKKVEDYRQSLLLYEYEKELVNQKLDKSINEQELLDFYEKNKNSFLLETNIYNLQYVRLPQDAEDLNKMRGVIMKPASEDEERRREGYCKAFATAYSLSTDNWMAEPGLLQALPLSEAELQNIRPSKQWYEFKREEEVLYFCISDKKIKGEVAPLQFIHDQLREIFLNKKKVVLVQKIYDQLYADGIKRGECEVLVRK